MATDARTRGFRRTWVLVGVLIVLAIVMAVVIWGGRRVPAAAPGATSNTQRPARPGGARGTPEDNLDVRIDALRAEREKPAEIERNPFRFEARRRPQPEGGGESARPPARVDPPPPPEPTGPPPPPPIALKFIGIIESPDAGRVAALSDGKRVFYGRAGDIIEGRYKIVRIGVESIVLEYADGTGAQQTIRLSGQ